MVSELFNDLKKYEAALRRRTNVTGATALLGLKLESLEKGRAVFTMKVRPRHKQLHGVMHGGVLATIALKMILHHVQPTMSFEVTPKWIALGVSIALLGSLCGALYPALKAARKDPIDALSYE